MQYWMPDKLYDVLKWVGLIACPALALFYHTIAPVWNLPYSDAVVVTLNAIGVLIGALIGASALTGKEVIVEDDVVRTNIDD